MKEHKKINLSVLKKYGQIENLNYRGRYTQFTSLATYSGTGSQHKDKRRSDKRSTAINVPHA